MHARQQILAAVSALVTGEVQPVYPLLNNTNAVRVDWEADDVSEVYVMGADQQQRHNLQVTVELQRKVEATNYQFIDDDCAAAETALSSPNLNDLVESWRLNNTAISRDIDGEFLCVTATLTYVAEYVTASNDPETIIG